RLTFLLLLKEFLAARDITAVQLGGHVFAVAADIFAGNELTANCRLQRHLEVLAWNNLFEFLDNLPAQSLRLTAVHHHAECIDTITSNIEIQLYQILSPVIIQFVIERTVAGRHALELIIKIR